MTLIFHSPVIRIAAGVGLVAGAWLSLSMSAAGLEASSPSATTIVAAGSKPILVAQADATPAPKPVSYSREQADSGEKTYVKECLDCHGEDLKGGLNGGAPLRGLSFEEVFANGAPASGLFLFMSSQMPPNAPGRYSAETYADLMAYILKRNGFQPGAPLPSDVDALDNLIIEK